MKKTISLYDFRDAFKSSSNYKDNFSYNWLDALFDYLEWLESETETEIDFDMVAICCEYSEYESIQEAYEVYKEDFTTLSEDEEERNEIALEWLQDNTQVITFDTGIIIQDF